MEILDMIKFLYREVNRLDTSFEKVILASRKTGFEYSVINALFCEARSEPYFSTTKILDTVICRNKTPLLVGE